MLLASIVIKKNFKLRQENHEIFACQPLHNDGKFILNTILLTVNFNVLYKEKVHK